MSNRTQRRKRGKYSRFVAFLKIGLPLVSIGLLGTVFLVTSPDDFRGTGLVFTESDREALGKGLRINNATISGATEAGDIYLFKAVVLVPDALDPKIVTADSISGVITFKNGTIMELFAETAKLDRAAQFFRFSGNARLQTSDGYVAHTAGLNGNLRTGVVESEGQIEADGPAGHIIAGSMKIQISQPSATDHAENTVIRFGNGVKLIFLPQKYR